MERETSEKHELFSFLVQLEKKELVGFQRFLDAGMVKKHQKASDFIKIVLRVYPNWDHRDLKDAGLVKHLFSGTGTLKSLRRLRSEILALLREYLIYLELREQESQKNILWLQALLKRQHFQRFVKDRGKAAERLAKIKGIESMIYWEGFQLLDLHRRFLAYQVAPKEAVDFHPYFDSLDQYWLIEKLRYACLSALQSNVKESTVNNRSIFLLEAVEQQLSSSEIYQRTPLIQLYFILWLVFQQDRIELLFSSLIPLLKKEAQQISLEDRKDVSIMAQSLIIKRINVGHKADYYRAELFKWYQAMVELKLIYEGEHLPHQRFKNIASIALQVGEFEWVDSFIKDHLSAVPLEERASVKDFILGAKFYYQEQYEACVNLLEGRIHLPNDFYLYDIYTLLARSYYYLTDYEGLLHTFDREFGAFVTLWR